MLPSCPCPDHLAHHVDAATELQTGAEDLMAQGAPSLIAMTCNDSRVVQRCEGPPPDLNCAFPVPS